MANDLFVNRHCMYTWLLYQAHRVGHMALEYIWTHLYWASMLPMSW